MASTSLFAPQVRSVQPAFVYNYDNKIGEVKIYFSLSSYNNMEEIGGILITIIDPNKTSTWGTNSMIDATIAPLGYLSIAKPQTGFPQDNITKEYYLTLDLTEDKYNIFTKNQYYQIQLYLIDVKVDDFTIIDANWMSNNVNNISAASQVSLIRPIAAAKIFIDGFNNNNFVNLQEFNELSGNIEYDDNSTKELIKEYKYIIRDKNKNILYTSSQITNTLGLKFLTKINYYFAENIEYVIDFSYITINGYESDPISKNFIISTDKFQNWPTFFLNSIKNEYNSGSVELSFTISLNTLELPGIIEIQRASEFTNFNKWVSISIINIESKKDEPSNQISFSINDYNIESGVQYAYRFVYRKNNQIQYLSDKFYHAIDYEDIFLSDKDVLLGIKYNPSITSFKWITQESITNTLGSVYPIIRRNGQTKYRQFNLSGTLFFNIDSYEKSAAYDSTGKIMNSFIETQDTSLFFSQEKTFEYITGNQRQVIIEKRMREYAMQFLTNGKLKLFRSFEEGNMIVYLSNISFTPNKTLNRHIYDFSCTVTEICEATEENLIKFSFVTNNIQTYIYVLNVIKTEETDDTLNLFKAYVSANEIVNGNAIRLTKRAVILDG